MAKPGWQLQRSQRVLYGIGMFSTSFVIANVANWLLYFYSPPPDKVDTGMIFLGAGVAVGVARLLSSLVDAMSNPLVAFWSDKSRNPKGRRVPFIRRGTIPLMVFAVLIWFPPVRGASVVNVVWLGVMLSCAWFFFTYVVAPYLALMPEITTNPEERVALTVGMSYWEAGATVIGVAVIPPVIEALQGGVQIGPLFLSDGFKVTSIVLAVIAAFGFYVSVSKIKEKRLPEESVTKFSLGRSIIECFRNPSFPPFLLAVASAKVGIMLVMISLPFLATAVLNKGESFLTVLMGPMFIAAAIGFAVAGVVVNRVGLKKAFLIATGAAAVLTGALFGTYFLTNGSKPLIGVDAHASGDTVFAFAEGDEGPGETPADIGRHASERGVEFVRVTVLEQRGFFEKPNLDAFFAHVEGLDDAAAAALIRNDGPVEREPEPGQERAWLLGLDDLPDEIATPVLYTQLVPGAAELLFTGGAGERRRYDTDAGIFVGAPALESTFEARKSLRISADIGDVEEPEETFNLEGWTMLFSSEEERAALAEVAKPTIRNRQRLALEGHLRYTDGSLVFQDFAPVTDLNGLSERARAALTEDGRLDSLMARFGMRIECAWSVRIWVIIALFVLLGFPVAILTSMYRPIVCEVADEDERRVGFRREAMYFGVEGLLTKSADGIGAIIAPAVMLLGHWLAPAPFGYILPFAAAGAFMLLGFWFFRRYPLGQPSCQAQKEEE